jgi:hypothetical protein
MGEGISAAGNKVFFQILSHCQTEAAKRQASLSGVGDVVGNNAIFYFHAWDNSLSDWYALVDGFIRDTKVEGTAVASAEDASLLKDLSNILVRSFLTTREARENILMSRWSGSV